MNLKSLLIIIKSDPRVGRRPAEAIRLAAGVGSWQKVKAAVCLCGPAILIVGNDVEDLHDAVHIHQYLPALASRPDTIFLQQGSPFLNLIDSSDKPFPIVPRHAFPDFLASYDYVLTF